MYNVPWALNKNSFSNQRKTTTSSEFPLLQAGPPTADTKLCFWGEKGVGWTSHGLKWRTDHKDQHCGTDQMI